MSQPVHMGDFFRPELLKKTPLSMTMFPGMVQSIQGVDLDEKFVNIVAG